MRGLVRSLMAELFPGLVKDNITRHRSRMGPRRATAAQQQPDRKNKPTFGKRGALRTDKARQRRDRDSRR